MADQWILPTDHEGCEWDNCINARDGDLDTWAIGLAGRNSWTPWLVVGFYPITAHKVQVRFRTTSYRYDGQLEIYKNGAWVNLFSDRVDDFSPEYQFMPGTVEKVRFRAYYGSHTYAANRAKISWIALWGCPSTAYDTVTQWFTGVGTFFHDLAADIRSAWLIGEYLAGPFEWIGDLFYVGSFTFQDVEDVINEALSVLQEGVNWARIEELFREHFPTLAALADDPIEWFLVQLTLAFDLEPWHTQSLEFLAKWILEEYFPPLYGIWLDSPGWFSSFFEDHFPVLYYLVTDPSGQVLYLIGQAFDLTPYEAQSPEFIVKTLFERYFPELYLLWRDPGSWVADHGQPLIDAVLEALGDVVGVTWGWLLDQFEEKFEDIQERLYSLAERSLRYFVEGVW